MFSDFPIVGSLQGEASFCALLVILALLAAAVHFSTTKKPLIRFWQSVAGAAIVWAFVASIAGITTLLLK